MFNKRSLSGCLSCAIMGKHIPIILVFRYHRTLLKQLLSESYQSTKLITEDVTWWMLGLSVQLRLETPLDPAALLQCLVLGRMTELGNEGLRAGTLGAKLWRRLISSALRHEIIMLQRAPVVCAGANRDSSTTLNMDALVCFQ